MIERRKCIVGRVEETFTRRVFTLEAGLRWQTHEPGSVMVTMQTFECGDALGGEEVLHGLIGLAPGQHGIIYERQPWTSRDGGVWWRYGLVVWKEAP